MFGLPLGQILLLLLALLVYLGVTQRVLDRMRMTDKTAIILIILMLISSLIPPLTMGNVAVNLGGALIPIGICLYLLFTANEKREKVRAVIASIGAAIGIILFDKILPIEPGALTFDLDPLFIPAVLAGGIAYGLGRSRRASFIAGVFGVLLSELVAIGENIMRGAVGIRWEIGGAGMLDAVLIAGVLAVVLAEVVGEIAERLDGKRLLMGAGFTLALGALILSNNNSGLLAQLDEMPSGQYFVIVDEVGEEIAKTGRYVAEGDKYITSSDNIYVVKEINNYIATAQQIDSIPIDPVTPSYNYSQTLVERIFNFGRRELDDTDGEDTGRRDDQQGLLGRVGFYHTHNAESYVPSDGTDSIYGQGGIHQVGEAFRKGLENRRVLTAYSQNLHLPHDRGAYRRSRRTVTRLMERDLVMLFDIHRDATPPEVYAVKIDDTWVTRIMIVVGRQNQNRNANLEFARELKAIADREVPGLIKGIHMAMGNYNQDLFSRALLLEVGSHTNARESAERSIDLFAQVVRIYLEEQQNEE